MRTEKRENTTTKKKTRALICGAVLWLICLLFTGCGFSKAAEPIAEAPDVPEPEPLPLLTLGDIGPCVVQDVYTEVLPQVSSVMVKASAPLRDAVYTIEEGIEETVLTLTLRDAVLAEEEAEIYRLPSSVSVTEGSIFSGDGSYFGDGIVLTGTEPGTVQIQIPLRRKIAGTVIFSKDACLVSLEFRETPLEGQVGSQTPDANGLPVLDWKAGGKRVALDAGHGGGDPGAMATDANGKEVREKNINLACMLQANAYLQATGVQTVCTRETNQYLDIQTRAALVNSFHADLNVSCHNNSEPSGTVSGTEVLYSDREGQAFYGITGEQLARLASKEVTDRLGLPDRGVFLRNDLALTVGTRSPGIIIEGAYLSNAGDLSYMQTTAFAERYGKGAAIAVIRALNQMVGVQ